MTLTQFAITGLAGFAVIAAGTLVFLPREITVARSATVSAIPSDIVALAASNAGYQRFNPYLSSDPELKIAMFGPDSGVGSGFSFDGKEGKGQQTVSAVDETTVHYAIDLGPMGKPSQSIQATAKGDVSIVTWEMQADLGVNPIARVMGVFMDKMVGPKFERGLQNLNAQFSAS